jgi:hypothetical protein
MEPMESKMGVKEILDDLVRMEDIEACLLEMHLPVGRKVISPEKIKLKNLALWELIKRATNDMFSVSQDLYSHGLTKMYFELKEYEIIMYFLGSRTALIVVIPALANRGLIEVEMENASRSIKEVLKLR